MPVARADGRPAVGWEDLPVMLVGPAEGRPAVALEVAASAVAVVARTEVQAAAALAVEAAARTEVPAAAVVAATEQPGSTARQRLKSILQGELHNARGPRCLNAAESVAVESAAGIRKIGAIERVLRLGAKLDGLPLANGE